MKNKIDVFKIINIKYSVWSGFSFSLLWVGGIGMTSRALFEMRLNKGYVGISIFWFNIYWISKKEVNNE